MALSMCTSSSNDFIPCSTSAVETDYHNGSSAGSKGDSLSSDVLGYWLSRRPNASTDKGLDTKCDLKFNSFDEKFDCSENMGYFIDLKGNSDVADHFGKLQMDGDSKENISQSTRQECVDINNNEIYSTGIRNSAKGSSMEENYDENTCNSQKYNIEEETKALAIRMIRLYDFVNDHKDIKTTKSRVRNLEHILDCTANRTLNLMNRYKDNRFI